MAQNNNFFFKAMAIFSFILAIANMFLIFRLSDIVFELENNQICIEDANESEVVITEETEIIEEQQIIEVPKIQKPVIEKPTTQKPAIQKPKTQKPVIEKPTTQKPAIQKPKKSVIAKKIKPSLKIRIEDRYAEREYLPEGQFTEEGEVVVKVYVDLYGQVTKTSIVKSSISNEDVQYTCREAALKTRFSADLHADIDSRLAGTITYTFSAE